MNGIYERWLALASDDGLIDGLKIMTADRIDEAFSRTSTLAQMACAV